MAVSTNEAPAAERVTLRTILVATDGTPKAHVALDAAADLAKRSGASLHLMNAFHVAPAAVYGYSTYIGPEDVSEAFAWEARTLLGAEQARVESQGVAVSGKYAEQGPIFDAVTEVAGAVDADLIVVGNRELSGLKGLLVGSASAHVLHNAHRPVLIVRGGPGCWPPAHVIVGFDRSEASERAAGIAAAIARLYDGATLTLVEVVPAEGSAGSAASGPANGLEEEHARLEADRTRLEASSGQPMTGTVAVGEPADALLARTEGRAGPHLVAVGTRGFGPVRRLLLGSVSTRILHAGHTSLLVVPPAKRTAE